MYLYATFRAVLRAIRRKPAAVPDRKRCRVDRATNAVNRTIAQPPLTL